MQGYLNNLTNDESSPEASTFWLWDLQTSLTSVKSTPGKIPWTGNPILQVHVW